MEIPHSMPLEAVVPMVAGWPQRRRLSVDVANFMAHGEPSSFIAV
jgi:hypothetical protein